MSQYGAYGFALNGRGYDQDPRATTTRARRSARTAGDVVRVLLQPSVSRSSFSGARKAARPPAEPGRTYYVRQARGTVRGRQRRRRVLSPLHGVLTVEAVARQAAPRGRGHLPRQPRVPHGRASSACRRSTRVGVEPYVRGVVARESPASWPAEALKAQAVAARTYALTTSKGGTRLRPVPGHPLAGLRRGRGRDGRPRTPPSRATRGQVVTYQGEPVVTYFFSTSGGRTEDVENTFIGAEPCPWLKSVEDPYDDESPKHRWKVRMTMGEAARSLSEYVKGSLQARRGRSSAAARRGSCPPTSIGSGGRTVVSGATLRAELGLYDTWAYFPARQAARRRDRRHEPKPGPGRPRGSAARRGGAAERHAETRGTAAPTRESPPLPRPPDSRARPLAVQPHQRLGDADRLVAALALEGHLRGDLRRRRRRPPRSTIFEEARSLEPTGSGDGKRTLSRP